MHFALLGRLRLRTGSGVVGLPGPVSRFIVARLLLARGGVVQRDTLIDELWGEREARNPANALQVQITKLRAAFAVQGEEGRLESSHGGYRTPRRGGRTRRRMTARHTRPPAALRQVSGSPAQRAGAARPRANRAVPGRPSTRSAASSPMAGPNLKPCPEKPASTVTGPCRSMTKSSSGVVV